MKEYKRKIKFHDKDNLVVISNVEITYRNKYPEFTMCNESNGGSGQHDFKPNGTYQKELHDLWDKYHLKKVSNPANFIKSLDKLCDKIKLEEENRFDGIEDWDDIFDDDSNIKEEVSNLEDEKIIALGKFLDLTPAEANEDITQDSHDDCLYSYSGIDYLVCTDKEADNKWDEELEHYIDECLEIPENIMYYFDREAWKSDARQDGRGRSLGRYDGNENEETVEGTYYYIYKQ